MTLEEIDQLEQQRTADYEAQQCQLKAEYEADIYAFGRVRQLLQEGRVVGRAVIQRTVNAAVNTTVNTAVNTEVNGRTVSPPPVHHPELPIINDSTIEGKVLTVIQKFQNDFTLEDLLAACRQSYPAEEFNENTVSAIVFRSRGRAVRNVRPGRRGQKAVYAKM